MNLPLTIAKVADKDGLLSVSGALPYEGYDDTFYLQYDAVSGYVILPPQEVEALDPTEGAATLLVPLDMTSGSLTVDETLTGRLDDGVLSFYNTNGKEGDWSTFAYVVSYPNGDISLVSYYASDFTPNIGTRSLAGTFALPSLPSGSKHAGQIYAEAESNASLLAITEAQQYK